MKIELSNHKSFTIRLLLLTIAWFLKTFYEDSKLEFCVVVSETSFCTHSEKLVLSK